NFDVSGYTGMGDSLWTPEFAVENIYQLADTVTWLRGRHSLKLGVDFRRQQRNFFQVTAPRGWYSFNGQYTQDLTTASGVNGLADPLFGNKHTVVRSAFGVSYSSEANIFDDLCLNPPFLSVDSQSFPSSIIPPASQFVSAGFPATVVFPDPANPSGTVRTNGPTRLMPRIFEWNFNVQQEVRENWVIQVAYVGTHAYRLWNHEASDLNQPLLPLDSNFSDATGNMGRPYFNVLPNLVTILPLDFPQLSVSYNSFQASVNHRFANGFNILAAYTLGKSLGTADGN